MFGEARDEQPVEVRGGEPVDERGEPRAGARSATRRASLRDEPAQRELVAVRAEPADHADRRRREHRVTALRLARVDVA